MSKHASTRAALRLQSPLPQAHRSAASALIPTLAFCAAIGALGVLTPYEACAKARAYVNTQFVEDAAPADKRGRLIVRNTSVLPRTVYARFQMPGDPQNRNNGFVQTIPPLSEIAYDLPLGAIVFACDGKYWDDYRPDEAYAVTVSSADTYVFTTREFQPAALRRANGE